MRIAQYFLLARADIPSDRRHQQLLQLTIFVFKLCAVVIKVLYLRRTNQLFGSVNAARRWAFSSSNLASFMRHTWTESAFAPWQLIARRKTLTLSHCRCAHAWNEWFSWACSAGMVIRWTGFSSRLSAQTRQRLLSNINSVGVSFIFDVWRKSFSIMS